MADIVVIGAGISGLASAWFLRRRGHRVRVVEAASQPGGCMQTVEAGGYLIEAGPNSTLSKGGAFDELVHDVGLGGERIEGNVLAKRRYVVKDAHPVALPGSPGEFLRTGLFTAGAKARLLGEPFRGRGKSEETVAQFVRRRLGGEFLDWAIDPFVSGVYAGDPEKLSVRAATAKVYALEAEHGSLIVGALARALRGRASGPQPVGKLVSFRRGMSELPRAIAAALGEAVLCARPVSGLVRDSGSWRLRAGELELTAEHVVLSTGAAEAAALIEPLDRECGHLLRSVPYPPVASIALGFDRAQVAHPLDGFGMLIPRRENRHTLGALFSSTLFPGRAPEGRVLLTVFIGGARNERIADLDDDELIEQVRLDLGPLLGISGAPAMVRVTRWPRAIPQYTLGHLDRMARVDSALTALPGLHLRANWRDGISVSDCVANARSLADTLPVA